MTQLIDGTNDPNKPYNMALARKLAKDVLFGLARKYRKARETNIPFTEDDEEKYAMGKIYDGLLILINKQNENK